jgi:hypothetical protein
MQSNVARGRTRKSQRGEEWWADVLADPRDRKRDPIRRLTFVGPGREGCVGRFGIRGGG